MDRLKEMDCDCNDSFTCPRCWAIAKIEEQAAQVAEIATDRLEFLKRAEAAEAQLGNLVGVIEQTLPAIPDNGNLALKQVCINAIEYHKALEESE